MIAVAGEIAITELRSLVGLGWIAFSGEVLEAGRSTWRHVEPGVSRLDISSIETSCEIYHEYCDPVWDLVCSELGSKARAHDQTFLTIMTADKVQYILDFVTPFFLNWLMLNDSHDSPGRLRFRGIVINKYDEAQLHDAVRELNAAGLLHQFLDPNYPGKMG